MAQALTQTAAAPAPARSPLLVIALAWLIPGAGHFLLGRRGRGAIIAAVVVVSFALGLMMQGPMFAPKGGDLLTSLIQYGGFFGDLASGILYLLTVGFGYSQPDSASHTSDYGAKFLVAAGLLNILAIVDAYEINTHQKD